MLFPGWEIQHGTGQRVEILNMEMEKEENLCIEKTACGMSSKRTKRCLL